MNINNLKKNSLYNKHIISMHDFKKNQIELILKFANILKNKPHLKLLKNKIIANCFFESSTRTRLSFETAAYKLGASNIGFSDGNNIALKNKGESLSDTISVISKYADVIIIRHPQEGSAKLASQFSNGIPIINAGDGFNQHPTQTILDLFTIKETQKKIKNLKIAIVGDLKYGRTVHSLTQALAKFSNNTLFFISQPHLSIPKYICNMLNKKKIKWKKVLNIKDIISKIDILYMTRIQRERVNPNKNINFKPYFILTAKILKHAKKNLKILHPLPRINEIAYDVDKTPYAYYFKQAENGIYARQAILSLILKKNILQKI
ncbi:aspartate carbamoyltransferase [Buchnera aphidicola]|uniref:aspartate carbamoyltransferase n=1 Tax=Buchnera aphidicola TaxID=9 RepID=UPI0030EDF3E2